MEKTLQDLRFALRAWRHSPGFALTIVATLAVGIGANTAIFSVVSGALLRPLPFFHADRLVQLYERQPRDATQGGFDGTVVYGDLEQWRAKSRRLEGAVFYVRSSRNLQDFGDPEQVPIVSAELGLFRVLGVAPLLGRPFGPGDAPNVAVASYAFWKAHFDGDRSAVGRRLMLDGQAFTLIGVMPESFRFPYESPGGLWLPWDSPYPLRPTSRLDAVLGRLQPGAPLEAARQELNAMEGPSRAHRIVRIRSLKDVVSGQARSRLLVLLGAVGMVLLVACVNVANLLLARTTARAHEIAVRAALGAGRARLLRQSLTESLLLALCSGLAGLGIGVWGSRLLVRIAAAQIPGAEEIGLDWRVFAFLLATCVATGIGFGLAPAIVAAQGGAANLKRRGVRATLRDSLVVVEVALAFILLAGAGLLLRTFLNLQRTNPGLNAENVLTVHVVVSGGSESMALAERIAQIPGVRAAGLISLLPLQNTGWSGFSRIPGKPEPLQTELRYVTPGYFRALGIPLRAGREFSPHDVPGTTPVLLVNEALARQYFPGEDPVGHAIDRGTIVGVVGDVRQEAIAIPAVPEIYSPVAQNFAQMRSHGSTLVVRAAGPLKPLIDPIRAAAREVSPGQALFRTATMQQVIDESLANPRLLMLLLVLFAAMGMLLAVAGIYGVIAYLVALRTREFGIRMALGADTGRVLRLVMSRGAMLIAGGLAAGLAGAVMLMRVLQGMLYGVTATDPAVFAVMASVLGAAALGACLVPARRAAQVDPAVALRNE
jgi:predicted permease